MNWIEKEKKDREREKKILKPRNAFTWEEPTGDFCRREPMETKAASEDRGTKFKRRIVIERMMKAECQCVEIERVRDERRRRNETENVIEKKCVCVCMFGLLKSNGIRLSKIQNY